MKIKNVAKGGRGLGIEGHDAIEWAPGETKDVSDAIIAKAKKDPANAAMFEDGAGLVVVTAEDAPRVFVKDEAAEAAAAEGAKDDGKKTTRR